MISKIRSFFLEYCFLGFFVGYKLLNYFWLVEGRHAPVLNDSYNYIWRINIVMTGIPVYDPSMVYTYLGAVLASMLGISAFQLFELYNIIGVFFAAYVMVHFTKHALGFSDKQVNWAMFTLAFYSSIGTHSFLHYVPSTFMVLLVLLLSAFVLESKVRSTSLWYVLKVFLITVLVAFMHSSGVHVLVASIPLLFLVMFINGFMCRKIVLRMLPVVLAVAFSLVVHFQFNKFLHPLESVVLASQHSISANMTNSLVEQKPISKIETNVEQRQEGSSVAIGPDQHGLSASGQAVRGSGIGERVGAGGVLGNMPQRQGLDTASIPLSVKTVKKIDGKELANSVSLEKTDRLASDIIPMALNQNDHYFSNPAYLGRLYNSFFVYFFPNKYLGFFFVVLFLVLFVPSLRGNVLLTDNRRLVLILSYWFIVFLGALYLHPRGSRILEMVFPMIFILLSVLICNFLQSCRSVFVKTSMLICIFTPLLALNYCFAKTENYMMKSLQVLDADFVSKLGSKLLVTDGAIEEYFLRAHLPLKMIRRNSLTPQSVQGKDFYYVKLGREHRDDYSPLYKLYRKVFPDRRVYDNLDDKWNDQIVDYMRVNDGDNLCGVYLGRYK